MEKHGRQIKSIWWNGVNGDEMSKPGPGGKMVFKSEYHGDRDEEWVCEYDSNGEEIARHNVRYIASIVWKEG